MTKSGKKDFFQSKNSKKELTDGVLSEAEKSFRPNSSLGAPGTMPKDHSGQGAPARAPVGYAFAGPGARKSAAPESPTRSENANLTPTIDNEPVIEQSAIAQHTQSILQNLSSHLDEVKAFEIENSAVSSEIADAQQTEVQGAEAQVNELHETELHETEAAFDSQSADAEQSVFGAGFFPVEEVACVDESCDHGPEPQATKSLPPYSAPDYSQMSDEEKEYAIAAEQALKFDPDFYRDDKNKTQVLDLPVLPKQGIKRSHRGTIEAVFQPNGLALEAEYNRCGMLTKVILPDGNKLVRCPDTGLWSKFDSQELLIEEKIRSVAFDRLGNLAFISEAGRTTMICIDGRVVES